MGQLSELHMSGVKMITQKRLKEVLHYNQETGIFTWRVKTNRNVIIGSIAGCNDAGYIRITVDSVLYSAQRLAWLYVYGYSPENFIDHKDRIPTNNWIENLREVSNQCNQRNTGNWATNTSGVKGVYLQGGKWRARVMVNWKHISFGSHLLFDEAVCHRLAGEQSLDWSGCDVSSPAFRYVKNNINKDIR